VEQVRTLGQLRELCADPLVLWAAQDMGRNIQVWTHGSAIVAAAAGLARRDRVAVAGPATDIAVIVRALRDGPGPRYRPIGDADTISQLGELVSGLAPSRPFGWMTTSQAPGPGEGTAQLAGDGEQAAIGRILDEVLMVRADNAPARSVYQSLGMTYRPLRAAAPSLTS
jgi:hypothetical protein